ncbi:hypothetical protein ACFFRE_01100 [Aciditerrimonas ferrireducens]|jgi:Flp pilus assembly protein TadB|uniref:Uncharacterized protein n=2 Tax=Aciditerrimonas ferrireducens TaxID=667306 RepID=A0ABV6BZA4_9ACTN
MTTGRRSSARRADRAGSSPGYRVGRQRSDPRFLALVALAWLAVGVVSFVALHASWRLVPGVFALGVGLLYLRGAAGAYLRRPERPGEP